MFSATDVTSLTQRTIGIQQTTVVHAPSSQM